jgi:hypothetical protein
MRSYFDYSQGRCTRGSVYYLAYEHGWQSRNHKAMMRIDVTDRYITRRRVLVFTISQSCITLSTIFSAIGLASRRYSLNCSSEQSAAAPCASTSSRALGQKDFTRSKAWLTHVVGASAIKLRTFYDALRSRSSKDSPPASLLFCGSTMSTSCWAAPLRSSNSF